MNLDINLLPKSKKRLTGIDALLLALIIIGILALLAYFAFYAPINHKKTLESK